MEEIWLDVYGFPGYLISSFGRIISKKTNKTVYLKPHVNKKRWGYCYITLFNKFKKKNRLLHRLVMANFVGELPNMQVNHRDGNKSNNRLDNLEYVTDKENKQHSILVLGNKNTHSSKGKLYQFDLKGNLINTYKDLSEAHKTTGIYIKVGRFSGGFLWSRSKSIKNIKTIRKDIYCTNIKTGDTTKFSSISLLTKILGITYPRVIKSIKNKTVVDGFTISY